MKILLFEWIGIYNLDLRARLMGHYRLFQYFRKGAITGKPKKDFIKELTNQKKGLYSFNTIGERNQLIITLTNLSDTLRAAGFRYLSKKADKKIKDLELTKKDA